MKSNVYIISVLVALTIHTVTQSMQAPGNEKKSYGTKRKHSANDNALLEASRKGDKAQLISLLESGSNIDTTDAKGKQPLHWAAQNGDTAIVELLLDRGATGIDASDKYGNEPLHLAAYNGHTGVVEMLLDRGAAGIDAPDRGGMQPLHWAARYGRRATIQLLLDRGATGIDAPDNTGKQPIHWAARSGDTATVELLLDRGATGIDAPDEEGMQPLHYAAQSGNTATVKLLLDRGATGIDAPDREGRQPLHWAAHNGHTAMMITLIAHGATIPDTMSLHKTLPALFAQSDFTSIPQIRFNSGHSYRIDTKTITLSNVFSMAAGQNKQETVETILTRHRTNLTDKNVIDALIGSATAGHEAMVRMLHDEMSNDRNLRSLVPETLARALSRAVAHRRLDVIRYLIEQDSFYDTPTFSLLRPAGTLLRRIFSPYTPSEVRASEHLSDYKRIFSMLAERQCWQCHTLPLIKREQAASVDREETVPYVPSPIISIPIEFWLIILNYLAGRHLSEIAK